MKRWREPWSLKILMFVKHQTILWLLNLIVLWPDQPVQLSMWRNSILESLRDKQISKSHDTGLPYYAMGHPTCLGRGAWHVQVPAAPASLLHICQHPLVFIKGCNNAARMQNGSNCVYHGKLAEAGLEAGSNLLIQQKNTGRATCWWNPLKLVIPSLFVSWTSYIFWY